MNIMPQAHLKVLLKMLNSKSPVTRLAIQLTVDFDFRCFHKPSTLVPNEVFAPITTLVISDDTFSNSLWM